MSTNTVFKKKQDIEQLWKECSRSIDFESEVLVRAHNLSKAQLQEEIDKRILSTTSGKIKGERLENLKKEAQFLAVMLLRRG